MKLTFLLFVFASFSFAMAASATVYNCNSIKDDGFGSSFAVTTMTTKILLSQTSQGDITGVLDKNYHPRQQNIGSVRFLGSVNDDNFGAGCGDVQIIIDSKMASGKNGKLVLVYDCDSDGTGPSFYPYSCNNI